MTVVNRMVGASSKLEFGDGMTLSEMLDASAISKSVARRAEIYIRDRETGSEFFVPPNRWHAVRLKPRGEAVLRVMPGKGGGGGKSVLGIVLSLAVMAAAAFAGPAIARLFPALGAASGLFGGIISGVIGINGRLFIGRKIK